MALLASVLFLSQQLFVAAAAATNYDLSSHQATITSNIAGRISIGGRQHAISLGQMVTPAEYAALREVAGGGHQTLLLSALGNAIGGRLDLGSLGSGINNLVIPRGVLAVDNFATKHTLTLTGNLINSGAIYGLSTSPVATTATIKADNIFNNYGAVIATVLPAALMSARLDRRVNLDLSAIDSIINAGTIRSSGALVLTAGNQIVNALPAGTTGAAPVMSAYGGVWLNSPDITNAGNVTSAVSNVNIASNVNKDVLVNSTGVFQALNGNINIRAAKYEGADTTSLLGGDFLSKNFNLNGGNGLITVNVGRLTGNVSSHGLSESVAADTPVLSIGNISIKGDPTYYNTGGDIKISGNITVGEKLAMIASGNVKNTASATITASNAGQGYDILILAGADFGCTGCGVTGSGTASTGNLSGTPPSGGLSSGSSITFGAGQGQIQLNKGGTTLTIDASSSGSGLNGGNVVIGAFNNGGKGDVDCSVCSINTTGGSGGNPGNVTIFGGKSGGGGLKIDNITANGGSSGGVVEIATCTPGFSSGSTMTLDSSGNITSGNTITAGAVVCCQGGGETIEVKGNIQGNTVTLASSRDVMIDTGASINVGNGGTVIVENINTTPTDISLGGSTNTFNLTTTELGQITAGTVQIGTPSLASSVVVDNLATSTINLGYNLAVYSSTGSFTQNATSTIALGSHQLLVNVGGAITTGGTISASPSSGGTVNLTGGSITTAITGSMTADQINMQTTNNGSITTNGNVTGNGTATSNGVFLTTDGTGNVNVNSTISETYSGAPITITTNSIAIGGAIKDPGNTVTITTNGNKTITVGGTSSTSSSVMTVNNGALNRVTAGTLVIGDTTTAGNMTIAPFSTTSDSYNLDLLSSGTITQPSGSANAVNIAGHALLLDAVGTATVGQITGPAGSSITVQSAATGNAITVNGAVSADTIALNAVTSGGSIVVGGTSSGSVTANAATGLQITTLGTGGLTLGQGGGITGVLNTATKNGPIDITVNNIAVNTGSSINAGTGTVTIKPNADNTSIGVAGGAGTLNITSAAMNMITAGKVVIGDSSLTSTTTVGGPVDLTGSSGATAGAGTYDLTFNTLGTYTSTGTITLGSHNLVVNASSITTGTVATAGNGTATFTASTGDIDVSGPVNTGTTSGTATLLANGSVTGSGKISGATVNLTATNGNIGNGSSSPLSTDAGTLTLTANSSTSGNGNAWVNEANAVTLNASSVNQQMIVNTQGAGNMTVAGALTGNNIQLSTFAGGGGNIAVNANIGTSAATTNVVLSADGSVTGTGVVSAGQGASAISLNSNQGNIGSSSSAPISTAATSLTLNAGATTSGNGNAWVSNATGFTLNASSVGSQMIVTAKGAGDITIAGNVTGNDIQLQTFAGGGGNINVNANIGTTAGTKNVALTANGSIGGSGTISSGLGAGTVSLTATNGSIGSSGAAMLVAAGTLNLKTSASGSAYISETGNSLTLSDTPTTGTLSVISNNGAITTSGALSAGTVLLQSYSTTNGIITATAGITGTSSLSLIGANGVVVSSGGLSSGGDITIYTQHLTDNGAITSSGSGATIEIRGLILQPNLVTNTDLTVDTTGTAGPITVTGGGAAWVSIQSDDNVLTLNCSLSLNAGSAGQMQLNGGTQMNIGPGVTISAGSTTLDLWTPTLALGSGSTISSAATSGTGLYLFTRAPAGMNVILPDSGTGTLSTSGGGIWIVGPSVSFTKTTGAGTAVLNLIGGPETITAATTDTTIASSVTVQSNNSLNIQTWGAFSDSGTLTTTGAGSSITIQGHGMTMSGTPNPITTNGGPIYVYGYDGGVTFSSGSNYTFNPGSAGTVEIDGYPGSYGNGGVTINSNISVAGGAPLTINTPYLTLGTGASISVAKSSGTALSIGSIWSALTISLPAGSTSLTTTGGNIAIAPLGGGNAVTFTEAGPATLNFVTAGGTTTLSAVSANMTIDSNLTLSSANNLVFNITSDSLVNNGKIISTGGNVTVNGSEIMSVTGTGSISGALVTLQSDSGISITQSAITGVVTGSSISDYSLNVTGSGGVTVGNVTASSGSVNITANGGQILVQAGATVSAGEGNLQIQNLSTAGTIFLDTGSTVKAFCSNNLSFGITTIGVGPLPLGSPVAGSQPSDVSVVTAGAGLAYFGANGITALGATNVVNAIGRNMIFDTGAAGSVPATAITLNGGVTVTSDPPVRLPDGSWAHPVQASELNGSAMLAAAASHSTNSQTDSSGILSAPALSNSTAINVSSPAGSSGSTASSAAIASLAPDTHSAAQLIAALPVTGTVGITGQRAESSSLATAGFSAGNTGFVSGGAPTVHACRIAKSRNDLKDGESLVVATTTLSLPIGEATLVLKPGTIALVKRSASLLTVHNLSGSSRDALVLVVEGRSIAAAAGEELTLAGDNASGNNDNISRRHVEHIQLPGGRVVTHSEFSLISLAENSPALAALIRSENPQDRQLCERILKTGACLVLVTSNHGAYTNKR